MYTNVNPTCGAAFGSLCFVPLVDSSSRRFASSESTIEQTLPYTERERGRVCLANWLVHRRAVENQRTEILNDKI